MKRFASKKCKSCGGNIHKRGRRFCFKCQKKERKMMEIFVSIYATEDEKENIFEKQQNQKDMNWVERLFNWMKKK